MNYTEKNHLPQWDENDRILRTDFNSAMENIENGINSAKSTAQSAQSAASAKPYKTGSYTGTGDDKTQFISVGFRPSFVIVSGQKAASGVGDGELHLYSGVSGGGVLGGFLTLSSSGFTVTRGSGNFPRLNSLDRKYDYIAFQ